MEQIEWAVTKLIKATNWPEMIQNSVKPSFSVFPRLYRLPKIHKTGCTLCPIVNTIGSPAYQVAKYLARQLKPRLGKTEAQVRNSVSLI